MGGRGNFLEKCIPSLTKDLDTNVFLNPLSPNIHIQILQTDLHTFLWRISWENLAGLLKFRPEDIGVSYKL